MPLRSALARALALALLASTGTGCFTYHFLRWGPDPPDLAAIEVGTSRREVEARLRAPVARVANVSTYEYNTREVSWWAFPLSLAVDAVSFGFSAVYHFDMRRAHAEQRAQLRIAYAPDGRVVSRDVDETDATYHRWRTGAQRRAGLQGELCRAANEGHPDAQLLLAMLHAYGLWGVEVDLPQALLWLRRAEYAGRSDAAAQGAHWQARLSSAERTRVAAAFHSWKAAPCAPAEADAQPAAIDSQAEVLGRRPLIGSEKSTP